ncbi:MAG: biotin--[acetyl-CoA-carboxylase] ligase [Bacteroidales bacterium]|nr:biotin--[acetyl-CoA-carboxylase] ligase [Bacteroidales bacterium]
MIIGSKIIFIRDASSTNTFASGLIREDRAPAEGTILFTNHQSAGRGQKGNKWESEDGKNILCSIILFPDTVVPEDQFVISMAVSLGIHDFLSEKIPDCRVKWPNDIYAGDDKISGVLIENTISDNRIENSIVGIGLNLNQTRFLSDAPNPVSLKMITGKDYDPEECIRHLAVTLDKRYKQILAGDYSTILDGFVSVLYRRNEWHNYRSGKMVFEGKIEAVTGKGHLIVEDRTGKRLEFATKEIEYIL